MSQRRVRDMGFMDKPCQLYRQFNDRGDLLYIGISVSSMARMLDHRNTASWLHEIATITVEHFTTRHEAMKAEVSAILAEKPKYNLIRQDVGLVRVCIGVPVKVRELLLEGARESRMTVGQYGGKVVQEMRDQLRQPLRP